MKLSQLDYRTHVLLENSLCDVVAHARNANRDVQSVCSIVDLESLSHHLDLLIAVSQRIKHDYCEQEFPEAMLSPKFND